jgi:hypothetical protein
MSMPGFGAEGSLSAVRGYVGSCDDRGRAEGIVPSMPLGPGGAPCFFILERMCFPGPMHTPPICLNVPVKVCLSTTV